MQINFAEQLTAYGPLPDVQPAPAPAPLQPAPELPWLVAKYEQATATQLARAYRDVAKGLAIFEEVPRGNLGPALRQHLNIIVAEQQKRGEVIL